MQYDYSQLFTSDVYELIKDMARSASSCEGYFIPCLIATAAFVVGNNSLIRNGGQTMPVNLFSIVSGPPTTGKSVALSKVCMEPLITLRDSNDMGNFVLERCTSSGMVKCLSEQKKAFVASPEVYDFLNKLLKNDEDNSSGDVQLLCELFSGERTSYRFATESKREIGGNIPMCILGLTQIPFGVCLGKREYGFTEAALIYLNSLEEDFITELNDSLLKGEVPPKSKKIDLVQRISVCLHVFNHVAGSLLRGRKPREPSCSVGIDTVKRAESLVVFTESQKQVVLDVSSSNFHLKILFMIFHDDKVNRFALLYIRT